MRQNLRVRYSAQQYDHYTAAHLDAWDEALIKRMVQERPREGGTVLDVGTGTAQLPVKAARDPALHDLRYVATDLFDDMLEEARRTVARHGLEDRIVVEKADAHALPYPDGSFEMVISRSTIHHWSDPAQAFREIFRVLKPRGVALIHDIRRDPAPDALARFQAQREAAGVPPTILEEKYTVVEVRGLLAQAGLARHSLVIAPTTGPAAIGFEARLQNPAFDGAASGR